MASQLAVDQATENAKLNGLQEVVKFQCEDVFALLPRLEAEGRKFDVIILDPPAFTKSRSSVKNAVKGLSRNQPARYEAAEGWRLSGNLLLLAFHDL